MIRLRRDGPPRLGLAIARRLVSANRRAEVEGDLVELWALRSANGRWARHRAFWRDVWSVAAAHRSAPAAIPDLHPHRRTIRLGVADMLQDLRFTVRLIRRQPAFAALVVATLTLGIAASTAIFTICDRVLVKPLPYPEPDRIVSLPRGGFTVANGHLAVPKSLRSLPVFSSVGLYTVGGLNLGNDAQPARVRAAAVSAGFFEVMHVSARTGRTFDAEENLAASKVVVLSHSAWRDYFQASDAVVGRSIRINSQPFVVVGVMPRGFTYPADSEVWVPEGSENLGGAAYAPATIARLAAGVDPQAAGAAMDRLTEEQRLRLSPESAREPAAQLVPVQKELAGPARPTLIFLGGLVGLLLLATCANVAGLLLSRLRVRERELAVRSALGASPARLARQLVTECGVLTAIGAMGGFALTVWTLRTFVAAAPAFVTDIDLVSIDLRFFAVGSAVALLCGLLFAIGPAASARRKRTRDSFHETRAVTSRSGWLTNGLLAGQVAAALVLLTATSAALAAVNRLMHVDLGFHNARAVVFELTLPATRYRDAGVTALLDRIDDGLRAVPGVVRVGATTVAPGSTMLGLGVPVASADDAEPPPNAPPGPSALQLAASPDYFQAMGIRLLAGRAFSAADRVGSPPVAILNETIARQLWSDPARAIGQHVRTKSSVRQTIVAEVVGVVADVRLRGVARDPGLQIYLPIAQNPPYGSVAIVVEAAGNPDAVLPAVRQALSRVDDDLPPYHVALMRDLAGRYLATERLTLALTMVFAIMALSLCAIGLYGALSQIVAQRTREIGIRMALGADRRRLRWAVVGTSLRVAGAGVAVGGLASGAAARAVAHLVPALDAPSTMAVGLDALVLLAVAALAAWIPARRASAVDPLIALRAE